MTDWPNRTEPKEGGRGRKRLVCLLSRLLGTPPPEPTWLACIGRQEAMFSPPTHDKVEITCFVGFFGRKPTMLTLKDASQPEFAGFYKVARGNGGFVKKKLYPAKRVHFWLSRKKVEIRDTGQWIYLWSSGRQKKGFRVSHFVPWASWPVSLPPSLFFSALPMSRLP